MAYAFASTNKHRSCIVIWIYYTFPISIVKLHGKIQISHFLRILLIEKVLKNTRTITSLLIEFPLCLFFSFDFHDAFKMCRRINGHKQAINKYKLEK